MQERRVRPTLEDLFGKDRAREIQEKLSEADIKKLIVSQDDKRRKQKKVERLVSGAERFEDEGVGKLYTDLSELIAVFEDSRIRTAIRDIYTAACSVPRREIDEATAFNLLDQQHLLNEHLRVIKEVASKLPEEIPVTSD
jgi:hypothetical protein